MLLKRLPIFAALAAWPLAAQTLSFTSLTVAAGNSPISVRLADFNGDSAPDIVVINGGGSDTVTVLLNQGGGNFSAPITTATGGLGGIALTSGDFNHVGQADDGQTPVCFGQFTRARCDSLLQVLILHLQRPLQVVHFEMGFDAG
jgi:hypothetical protein